MPSSFARVAVLVGWFAVWSAGWLRGDDFVRVSGHRFERGGQPYFVAGTNLWYAAHLGRPSNPEGRARLRRELDRLAKLGVNNLRVLGAAEACAAKNALAPAIQTEPGKLNEDVLIGLDFAVSEAAKRNLTLVIFLNNYWDWSGGMPQYLAWATGEPVIPLGQVPWREFNRHQATFYPNERANALYRDYVRQLLERKSTVTGRRYADEPAIMAWELANEPRPGEADDRAALASRFVSWVKDTAAYLHRLDARHLVTTGSEGHMGCLESYELFERVHAAPEIDYATFHLWPNNWRWFNRAHWAETIQPTLQRAQEYVTRHLASAARLDKPLVLEEFGLDRDGALELATPTTARDRLYAAVFAQIEASVRAGGPAAGSNFWLWGGEGRPPQSNDAPDGVGAGDMLQEAPGLNTVFDADATTLAILRRHYAVLDASRVGQRVPASP